MTIQKITLYCLASVFILFTTSCSNDDNDYQKAEEDILQENITSLYGSLEALQLPLENDLNNIPPQTPFNTRKGSFREIVISRNWTCP